MGLNAKQVEQLLRPVNPRRVQRDNNGMSHLAAYDVSAHLTRIFGFGGWEKRITSLELVSEQGVEKNGRTGWWVTYRCQMTLLVKDSAGAVVWSNDDGATGSASNLPGRGDAHDFALKNAISYALKRCAKDLGDQFGLSLYNKGSLKPLVGAVLNGGDEEDVESALPDEMHPDAEENGTEAAEPAQTETAAPAAEAPPARAQAVVDDPVFGDWAAKIDTITSGEDAENVRAELDKAHRGGIIDSRRAAMIRGAIKDKEASLGNGQAPRAHRPKGPSAEERGAQAVPTGSGDDGEWVQHFTERVKVAGADDLSSLQGQIGNAVRARKITPGKAAGLSKAIQAKRAELAGAPA